MNGVRPAIVIDNGSGNFRAGLGGDHSPKLLFPSVIGTANQKGIEDGINPDEKFIGKGAQEKRGLLSLKYPIQKGIIRDWDLAELLWDYTFRNLGFDSSNDPDPPPVLLTEPPLNPKRNRERMVQLLFDNFRIPFAYVGVGAVLSLYSSGRTTGIVTDSGEGVTYSVPVYENYGISHAIHRMDIGGAVLNEHLSRILTERGYSFMSSAEIEVVREIKENLCYVNPTPLPPQEEEEDIEYEMKHYETADGRVINLGNERFRCPEGLFSPARMGIESPGIHELISNSITATDIDVRAELWHNIILTGGNTRFPGFLHRLQRELGRLAPAVLKVRVHLTENDHSSWLGGSVLTSLEAFRDLWISQEEYDEVGPAIVHRKCW